LIGPAKIPLSKKSAPAVEFHSGRFSFPIFQSSPSGGGLKHIGHRGLLFATVAILLSGRQTVLGSSSILRRQFREVLPVFRQQRLYLAKLLLRKSIAGARLPG